MKAKTQTTLAALAMIFIFFVVIPEMQVRDYVEMTDNTVVR